MGGEEKEVLEVKEVLETKVETPVYGSQEWSDYVMTLFSPNELFDGNPTCAGLRRVAENLLGPISFSGPTQVFPSNEISNMGRATVVFTVRFSNWMNAAAPPNNLMWDNEREYAEVADVWHGNCDDKYAVFPIALASTRAEGRALRKALKVNCVAVEEITRKAPMPNIKENTGEWEDNAKESLSDAQKKLIVKLSKQVGVEVEALLKYKVLSPVVEKITKGEASELIKSLNEYIKTGVPQELKGV